MDSDTLEFKSDPKLLGELLEKRTLLDKYGNIESLCSELHSSLTDGISNDINSLKKRKEYFGANYIQTKMPHRFSYYFFKAFNDYMLIFLIIGGIVIFITEMAKDPNSGGVDGIAIIIAVIIIVTVSSVNDYSKEMKFKNLHKTIKLSNTCTVLRDKQVVQINTIDLVVGDIYMPTYGDQVPADAIVFQENGLKVDESSITGEAELVSKIPTLKPYLLAGTHIMEGSGKSLVTAVGVNSQTGRILELLGANKNKKKKKKDGLLDHAEGKVEKPEKISKKNRSVLQEKLNRLALLIGKFGVAAGVSVFTILMIRYCVQTYGGSDARSFVPNDLLSYLDFLIEGFSVVIVAVPEGLPLAVTLALAYSVTRMLKDNNLVRQLYSCETMGNATTICSDKTGTLTTNRMTVVQAFIGGVKFSELPTEFPLPDIVRQCLCMNICINKSPSSRLEETKYGGLPTQWGNKTDCALLGFLSRLKTDYGKFITSFPEDKILKIFPFNSNKKFMLVVVDLQNGYFRILIKGAPDVLLSKCVAHFIGDGGEIENISASSLKTINITIDEMAKDALRTILLAYKDIPMIKNVEELQEADLLTNLTFLVVFGIEDPVRKDVPDAIKTCIRAGITVRMVTGDNLLTARSIAQKCGILTDNEKELILDSKKFNSLICDKDGIFNQNLFDKVWPRLRVLARSSPKDKYVLINGIINTNLSEKPVVAVTGDGTNDAPALKRADVGFAMGLTGTDTAKEACDIIITDDNFSNIVSAIKWGRNVYDSISKFIQFQLTVNVSAILLTLICACVQGVSIFQPIQMLWVNLLMDSFASLALATDSPTEDLLDRKPYHRDKSLISKNMAVFIILHSCFQVTVVLILLFFGPKFFSFDNDLHLKAHNLKHDLTKEDTIHSTFIFNVFVLMQVCNEINARKIHGERNVFKDVFKNKIFVSILVTTCVVQFLIVQFTHKFFHVVPLNLELWLWSICIGLLVLVYHQLVVITVGMLVSVPKKFRIQTGVSSALIVAEEARPLDARMLWIRGFKKLQQEIRVIQAFREGLVINRRGSESVDGSIYQYYTSDS